MENMVSPPTPEEAAAALADAQDSRRTLAAGLVLPSYFYSSLGITITVQIATASVGLSLQGSGDGGFFFLAIAGIAAFFVVGGVQLRRFRRQNGVRVAGLAHRVIGGTTTLTSLCYGASFSAALWAAFSNLWWLVAACSLVGGASYAWTCRRWWQGYQNDPQTRGRRYSTAYLAALIVVGFASQMLLAAANR
jgi:hypothetical protein